jgi:hypothetical protein
MFADASISVALSGAQVHAVRCVADESEIATVDHPIYPELCRWQETEVLISSHGAAGWAVAIRPRRSELIGHPSDLRALCASLAATGRKRDMDLAGRIKATAAKRRVDSSAWLGERAPRKPSKPKSIKDIARAWRDGKALRSGNVRTDGQRIYSWGLCIGETVRGRKVAIDYRGKISKSTSMHCGAVIGEAHRVSAGRR